MGIRGNVTDEWFRRADGVLVNGVSSGFRYWGDDDTLVIDRGEGGHVFDMDGSHVHDSATGDPVPVERQLLAQDSCGEISG